MGLVAAIGQRLHSQASLAQRPPQDLAGAGGVSKLPLSLTHLDTDARYPSVEHVTSPTSIDVALEVRVVNDMKTILSENEFRQLIGHLAATMGVVPARLDDGWTCERTFGRREQPEEPPA